MKMNSVSLLVLTFAIITMHCDRIEASKFNRKLDDNSSVIVFMDSDKEVTDKIPEKTSPMQVTNNESPDIDNRFVLVGPTCPTGYAKIGGWCVEAHSTAIDPEYDWYEKRKTLVSSSLATSGENRKK